MRKLSCSFRVLVWGFVIATCPAYAATQNAPATETKDVTGLPTSLWDALKNGTPLADVRYRYEDVQQNNISREGAANTVRTRLGYETGAFKDFKARVQIQNLSAIGAERYNDGTNALTKYPVIADPRQTVGLYEANLSWQGLPQSTLTFGRQALSLDNQRWVGIADWRQLGQTMDAVTGQNNSIKDLNIFYSYVFNVNRVYGPRAIASAAAPAGVAGGTFNSHAHLMNASYTGLPGIKLIGYSYLLDLTNAPTLSSATTGGRIETKHQVWDNVNLLFNGEYARQVSYTNNPTNFGYNYYLVEPGAAVGPFTARAGYEVMGGDGNHSLQTPLDTAHAFNGWAERFLTTPATGLTNFHIAGEYKSPSWNSWLDSTNVKFVWYDFNADSSSLHYGNEYDVWLAQTFFKHYTLALQYAQYVSDNASLPVADARKIVLQLQAKY